jgi:hypothetical protein
MNLSVWLSLSQTSKNAMSFILSLMFSLQQNGRTRSLAEQFNPDVGVEGEVTQTVYTHVGKYKKMIKMTKKE